ncbi:MAG: hypothetical protein JWN23_2383 [Rhodocyclales bacterium]|nr:hypothetical protein [Rhodocyclales bacterium]
MNAARTTSDWDVIIIGGGSSGCVLANRLSENPQRKVLLLEAGPDGVDEVMASATDNGNQPAVVAGLNWKYRTFIKGDANVVAASATAKPANSAPQAVRGGVASIFDYEAGRLLGGSSAVNATQTLRGAPADYDEWAKECGPEWTWEAVLPYFRKLENDPLGPSPLHGAEGPFPIRRETAEQLTPLQAALAEACIAHGFGSVGDHNDPTSSGVGVIPKNVVDGRRISTKAAYLDPVRARENLTVMTGVHVHRVLWAHAGLCSGVEAEQDGRIVALQARHVVLCAGVMSTPAVLMRSGVGDPRRLEPLGIPVVLPLRAVGENFMEHPVVGLWGIPREGVSRLGEPLRQTLLRYSSGISGNGNDMHICMMAGINVGEMFPRLNDAANTSTLAGLTVCYNKSVSRGRVSLSAADPHAPPIVANNCLGDPADVLPLIEGVRLAWDLLNRDCLRQHFAQILAWTDGLIRSDLALAQAVKTFVRPAAHACGSARMGSDPDKGAVADPHGRVFGTDNLWIADASLMPRIPSAPPHLSCLMIAEKIADELQSAT